MKNTSEHGRRARWAMIVLGIVALGIWVRLIDLQVVHGRDHFMNAERLRVRRDVVPASRGEIVDRDGRPLVDNFASFVVTLDPFHPAFRKRGVLQRIVGQVAAIVEGDSTELAERVRRGESRSFHPTRLKRKLSDREVAQLEEAHATLPGVEVRVEPLRRYPEGALAAHVLGYMGERADGEVPAAGALADDAVGRTGLERVYEERLRGVHGVRFVEVDARGRIRSFGGVAPPVPAIAGDRVVSTIVLELQRALENGMDEILAEANRERLESESDIPPARAGAAVALDVWTGDVVAMVSRPAFDPNAFATGLRSADWRALVDDPERPLLNRVIQANYPPGSIFKSVVAVAALANGVVTSRTVLEPCTGTYAFGNRRFGCWLRRGGHGALTLRDAFAQSCDVYFYQLGERLGVDGIAAMAMQFETASRTGIGLPGEVRGLTPSVEYLDGRFGPGGWGRGAALNHAIGQGEYLMTPLSLAVLTAVIANGGARVEPRVVAHLQSPSGEWEVPAGSRLLVAHELEDELAAVRAYMRTAVERGGTATRAAVPGLAVSGKTATSQNSHGEDHAMFASFAPSDQPHLALVVVLERRGGGGRWAAPVAARFWAAYRDWRERTGEGGEVG
jgi:penicillin-binding protein 2